MAQRDIRAALKELGGEARASELTDHLLDRGILTCSREEASSLVSKGLNRMAGWGEVERTPEGRWRFAALRHSQRKP